MVKHLVNLHSSPLALRVGRHTLYTPAILLPFLLREKEIPTNLVVALHDFGSRLYKENHADKALLLYALSLGIIE